MLDALLALFEHVWTTAVLTQSRQVRVKAGATTVADFTHATTSACRT